MQNKRFKEDIKPADKRCELLGLNPDEVAMFLKLQDSIFSRWVDKDPLAAVEWCNGLLSFPPKTGYEKDIFYMNFDQEGLLPEWKAAHPGNQYRLLASMIACWGKKDLNAATEWAQAQSKGVGREAAMVGVAVALSRENPAEAITKNRII